MWLNLLTSLKFSTFNYPLCICISLTMNMSSTCFNLCVQQSPCFLPLTLTLCLSLFLYLCFGAFVLCLREWKLGHFEMKF